MIMVTSTNVEVYHEAEKRVNSPNDLCPGISPDHAQGRPLKAIALMEARPDLDRNDQTSYLLARLDVMT